MRELVEQATKDREHDFVLVDGVKVLHPDGWALVLPDPEEPTTHVGRGRSRRPGRPSACAGVRPRASPAPP